MAYINNFYVFVEDESVSRGVEVSEHPVETGLDITDNIKRSPVSISISGAIVGDDAASILSSLIALHQNGKLVKYSGRNILSNAIIAKFDTGHPNTVNGGCEFDMEIREIRIAKNAYVAPVANVTEPNTTKKPTIGGTQQVEKNNEDAVYYTVKKGDSFWGIAASFYGNGSLYPKIYEANGKPSVIHPGDKLLIP